MSSDSTQFDSGLSELEVLKDEYSQLRGRLAACQQSMADKGEFQRWVAADQVPLSALCLSGGGIRSATFNLGVLQAMAKHGLLERMDYLSTVSGGGYIGSWLTSWIHRNP